MGGEPIIQMQELVMEFAKQQLSAEEVATKVREALIEAMGDGRKLVIRMGQSTPDWMLSFNIRDVLPVEFLRYHPPGALDAEVADEFGKCSGVQVLEGFSIVLTSCFSMDSYKQYFKAKLPFAHLQPIQVMTSLEEVSAVLADGLPKDEMDDQLAELDRLA